MQHPHDQSLLLAAGAAGYRAAARIRLPLTNPNPAATELPALQVRGWLLSMCHVIACRNFPVRMVQRCFHIRGFWHDVWNAASVSNFRCSVPESAELTAVPAFMGIEFLRSTQLCAIAGSAVEHCHGRGVSPEPKTLA